MGIRRQRSSGLDTVLGATLHVDTLKCVFTTKSSIFSTCTNNDVDEDDDDNDTAGIGSSSLAGKEIGDLTARENLQHCTTLQRGRLGSRRRRRRDHRRSQCR